MNFTKTANQLLESTILGLIEDIEIKGVGKLKAKTDTGNEAYNVLHGTNVKVHGKDVSFDCVNSAVSLPLLGYTNIHYGKGKVDKRPVVSCTCFINGKIYKNIPFSIADRKDNNYKILLGQNFIKKLGGVVNILKKDGIKPSF